MKKATFGAGCFWHVEEEFSKLKGVLKTTVGYMGGHTKNPTYEEVCTNKTGHAEVVEVEFDPEKAGYGKLLDAFWKMHDPTQFNRQGPDIGTQYRSVIFYYDDMQRTEAENSRKEAQKRYDAAIQTKIEPAKEFWPAEANHQQYFKKHGKVCGFIPSP